MAVMEFLTPFLYNRGTTSNLRRPDIQSSTSAVQQATPAALSVATLPVQTTTPGAQPAKPPQALPAVPTGQIVPPNGPTSKKTWQTRRHDSV